MLLLLAHKQTPLQEEVYKLCYNKVIDTVGPKLNVSEIGTPGWRIQFLLHSEIFIEIAAYGLCSENIQVLM